MYCHDALFAKKTAATAMSNQKTFLNRFEKSNCKLCDYILHIKIITAYEILKKIIRN